jgi:hypothetical protein
MGDKNVLKSPGVKDLVTAISNRHPISFMYYGDKNRKVKTGRRIYAEPVALGYSKRNNLIVRCYIEPPTMSTSGYGRSYWRTFLIQFMRSIVVNRSKTFDLNRDLYNGGGDDGSMIRTIFSNQKGAKKTTTPKQEPKKKDGILTRVKKFFGFGKKK